MRFGRKAAVGAGLAAGGAGVARARRTKRHVAYPPGPEAIEAQDARAATDRLLAQPRVSRRDLTMPLAATLSTSVDPLLHGRRYFPRMLDDIAAATDSIHLLIYGYKPGEIGTTFFDVLGEKVRAGVEVRLQVDAIGSEIDMGSRKLFRGLRDAGIVIVANDGILPDRDGPLGKRHLDWRLDDFGHFDHRKMMVVDGRVGYVGGSGIEDHYNDERFYDVMCRVTGPILAQLQLVFFASWRFQGGPPPSRPLDAYFPADALDLPVDAATTGRAIPTTVLWNVPGEGHHPISDAIEQSLEEAQRVIHIVNPYIADRAILERILDAARRGVETRIVAPGKPTPPYPAAAFRHHYQRLLEAGVKILLHPQMAHAKVLRIDDRVFVGGCNLDALSLYRNDELDLLFESPEVAELTERQVFDELVEMSVAATVPTGRREKVWNATMDRVSRFL
jgi:cardiolipin synthase